MAKLNTDWSTASIVARREKYYAASQRAFVPYKTPLIFAKGDRQYLWDETGKKYLDLLGMNVCVSVGHNHPTVTAAVREQIEQLQHCTTMFYHPVPAHFAEELAARMPKGHDWVVHFTNSGTEAVDLALVMAQQFTGNIDMLALRNAYHGATIGAQSLTGISGFRHNIPLLTGIHHVANPDPYRGIFGDDTDAYLAEIDRTIQYATSGKLAGFIVEPIQGYGGVVETPDWLSRRRCRQGARAWRADDHRRGPIRLWPHRRQFLGLRSPWHRSRNRRHGQGYWQWLSLGRGRRPAPCCRCACQENSRSIPMAQAPPPAPPAAPFCRSSTRKACRQIPKRLARQLRKVLDRLHQKHEIIGEVRSHGLMLAIELVTDRKSKTPAAAAPPTSSKKPVNMAWS